MPRQAGIVNVVVGILQNNGRVLVAERPEGKPYSGYWEFPGGKIESTEDSLTALRRELKEELGIDVISADHWFTHEHAYPDRTVLLNIWLVGNYQGEPAGKENQRLHWAGLDDMVSLQLLQGNLAIMERIKTFDRCKNLLFL